MLRRYILYKSYAFINCRYASQSMLQSKIDDKTGFKIAWLQLLVKEKLNVPDVDNALNKGTQFLNNFQKISPWAYKMTKDISRQAAVQWLIDNKQKDLDFVTKFLKSPGVQKS
ncbi:Hypothetical protein CINCED_3A011282 [Cinara cedri]|uniref:Uncharacterized protein n=1 Tax=Cinara cedri TaxID=506608 RepID=A0A5E4M7P4_9HEMI|nr:Hypothetical protein CINCED_3A011282 [Cinara cedri]